MSVFLLLNTKKCDLKQQNDADKKSKTAGIVMDFWEFEAIKIPFFYKFSGSFAIKIQVSSDNISKFRTKYHLILQKCPKKTHFTLLLHVFTYMS